MPPYAQAVLPALVAQQRYDISLQLQIPNLDANYALGNFMTTLTLSTPSNKTLVSIRRPVSESAHPQYLFSDRNQGHCHSPARVVLFQHPRGDRCPRSTSDCSRAWRVACRCHRRGRTTGSLEKFRKRARARVERRRRVLTRSCGPPWHPVSIHFIVFGNKLILSIAAL